MPVISPMSASVPVASSLRRAQAAYLPDCAAMNFARDVVDAAPAGDRALVEIDARRHAAASGPSARSPTAARGSPATLRPAASAAATS